jgi:hypothetical protein
VCSFFLGADEIRYLLNLHRSNNVMKDSISSSGNQIGCFNNKIDESIASSPVSSPSQIKAVKNEKGTEKNGVIVQTVKTVFIPLLLPNPRSLTWTQIAYNIRCDDEPVLR